MGHECISIKAADHGVTVTALFDRDGIRMEKDIHCNFLIGADGARSTVRELVGINMKGERDLQKLVSIHFSSQDLGQYLVSERPGMLFFIFNTEAIGVLVAHDLNQGEFVLQVLGCSISSAVKFDSIHLLNCLSAITYSYIGTVLSTATEARGLQL